MKKEKYLEYRKIFESNYLGMIKLGKHDLGFVNLHDLKTGISRYSEFVFIYSCDINCNFTNTVNSIDRRKRFITKYVNHPAIKIKIDFDNIHLIDRWPERFKQITKYYKNNKINHGIN